MVAKKVLIGETLIDRCANETDVTKLQISVRTFMKHVVGLFVEDLVDYYSRPENILKVK